ncbi:MAG: phage tail protein [Deltaproteobacteria bacterium]|nr:phage tail protein [Deltaproteobacteria bacterium]
MASEDTNPYGNYYFSMEITKDGGQHSVAQLLEVSGLKSAAEVFEISEGGLNSYNHKRAGQSRWENIVIKYASTPSTFLVEWRDRFLQDQFGERLKVQGAIHVHSNRGDVIKSYVFEKAWPVSWEGPSFSGDSSALAVETMEIAHGGLKVSNG